MSDFPKENQGGSQALTATHSLSDAQKVARGEATKNGSEFCISQKRMILTALQQVPSPDFDKSRDP
jgi:hypothetical protein